MKYILTILLSVITLPTLAQAGKTAYPLPEYSNEIYLFKKDSAKLGRLEKGTAKAETKTKMGGMGGMETSYSMDGASSTVKLTGGSGLCFIFYTGKSATIPSTPQMDSAMQANGMSKSSFADAMEMFTDPAKTTSLYDMTETDSKRKIITMSAQGMKLLGKAKKPSTKYTLSVKKIKEGYYELLVDKTLPKGEYAFMMTNMMGGGNDVSLFAFTIQ